MDQASVIALTLPTLAVLVGILVNNRQFDSFKNEMRAEIGGLRAEMNAKFEIVNQKFEVVNHRFEAARQQLLRVEEVLDARLKHLEEQQSGYMAIHTDPHLPAYITNKALRVR